MTNGRSATIRVPLKGINRVRKRLRSGETRVYYYAWKSGPPLTGRPGTPEFLASYHEALAKRRRRPTDTMQALISQYCASPDFSRLAPRTRKDYAKHLLTLERDFGDFPLAAIEDRRTRGEFLDWRDRLSSRPPRQADYAYAVLALILSWSKNRGLIAVNPCERGRRVYRADRSDKIWLPEHEQAFLAKAASHLHLALKLALWTGQRQGDLLRLTWASYDGHKIRLKQGKTGARVEIPVGRALKADLDALLAMAKAKHPAEWMNTTILLTDNGTPWTEGGFRASWRKA